MRNIFFLFLFFFLFCVFNELPSSTGQEITSCTTPDDESGTCISLYQCPDLLNLLHTRSGEPRVRTYLRASTTTCGFIGQTPRVCCPKPKTRNPSIATTTTEKIFEGTESDTILPRKPDCGFSNVTNPRIVNGIPAKLGEYPWIVALGYKNSRNPRTPKWLCGGSMITDRHVLTAGHCVHNRKDLYLVRVGDLDLYSDTDGAKPENILISKVKLHENYSPLNFTNDIAIITLSERPKSGTVWPICLPLDNPLRSENFVKRIPTVAGWGSVYFQGPSSATLQEAVLPVVENSECKRAFGARSVIDERILCAGQLTGGQDACQGDSGGPLMLGTAESSFIRYYQIGVVSYGFRCAEPGFPGVYTRTTAFLDWIQRNLN